MILDLIGIALSFLFFASGLSMLCYGYQHYWNGRTTKMYYKEHESKTQ